MPQGSVLESFLFTLYINNIDQNVHNWNFHYYADDTVIYSSASTPNLSLSQLQLAFNIVQHNLFELKPVLNADITACFLIQNQSLIIFYPSLFPSEIEFVSQYRYPGILIDDSLSFVPHVWQLVKRLKIKLGFYCRVGAQPIHSCLY